MSHISISRLSLSILSVLAVSLSSTSTIAGGLDRSGQDTTAFFQDGTYAEAVYTYIDADVNGFDNAQVSSEKYVKGKKIDSIAEPYDFFRFGVKSDVNDMVSVGVLYTEPWGASVDYTGDNNLVSKIGDSDKALASLTKGKFTNIKDVDAASKKLKNGAMQSAEAAKQAKQQAEKLAQQAEEAKKAGDLSKAQTLGKQAQSAKKQAETLGKQAKKLGSQAAGLVKAAGVVQGLKVTEGQSTEVEIRSNSLTGIVGVKLGEKKNIQIYGGPVAQRVHGHISLRGPAYGASTGYDAYISNNTDYGWLGGVSYSKPEIALKASLTYRSPIDHVATIDETVPFLDSIQMDTSKIKKLGNIEINTPESINLDFQTGINPTTLATVNVRYVPWSEFAIIPPEYNALTKLKTRDDKGLPIASYSKDQWQVELGLAKRINPKLALSGIVGWDSGAGNPVSSLGPIKGYYSAGLGAKYNLDENWAISGGAQYLVFGDADAKLPDGNLVGKFEDNKGFLAGVKLSYQKK